ncbi:MAG: hypothetical protein ABI944_05110 [Chthoniobacterales bacterium]
MDRTTTDEQTPLDPIDVLLREEAPYIDDAGFTARVAQQLPMRRQRRSLRALIFASVGLLAALLTYMLSGGGRSLEGMLARIAVTPLPLIYLVAAVAGLLVMFAGLASAISKDRRLT